jgi:hypothetical protein
MSVDTVKATIVKKQTKRLPIVRVQGAGAEGSNCRSSDYQEKMVTPLYR